MYLKSKFNFTYMKNEDTYLLYNTFRNSLLELDEETFKKYENSISLFDNSEIQTLYQNGFLIDESCNEIEQLKHKYNIAKYDTRSLSLTIAPSLLCNMSCPYCYETVDNKSRDNRLLENLWSYIENKIEEIELINIVWYGGEPLLELDFIKELSSRIRDIAIKLKKNYSFSMITNGYLLNNEIISELKFLDINDFQITLDGGKKSHDYRRKLKNGTATFDNIIENIKKLLQNDLSVTIRINIDKNNSIEELKHILEELLLYKEKKLNIYLARIEDYNKSQNECLNVLEFSKYLIPFYKLLIDNKFSTIGLYPSLKTNYCTADQVNSFVVDNRGSFFKCWVEIGELDKICGVSSNIQTTSQFNNMIEYISKDIFNDIECLECKYLPLCMGGCPYKNRNKEKNCEEIKLNLKEKIKLYSEII